jgi:hypothetical protein
MFSSVKLGMRLQHSTTLFKIFAPLRETNLFFCLAQSRKGPQSAKDASIRYTFSMEDGVAG